MSFASQLRRRLFGLVVSMAFIVAIPGGAHAQIGSDRYSSIVVDERSGQIISAANADEYRFPASLTKMMTIYMVFEAIRDRQLSFSDAVPVSSWAASMPPTKLGLIPGTTLSVEQAIMGLVTKSANDAAAALGELLGGDEDRFAQLMTTRAHALGMSRTTFRNASGLPDWGQVTTARDLATLARHLIQDFPQYYHYFSTPSFIFHGRFVPNHQAMLRSYAGADGLKTGYTEASGYNVVTSALRGDVRLIGVVMGASNGWERDQHMTALLDQGFMRMGVGSMDIVRREPAYRVPSLIGSARAAPVAVPAMAEVPSAPWRRGRRQPARLATSRQVVRPVPGAQRPWASALRQIAVPPRPVAVREPVRAAPRGRYEPKRASAPGSSGRYPG
ncbi:MAG: D-alanyl-D-alanine carboxypeptidase family protein [Janthinobacterium lividum]